MSAVTAVGGRQDPSAGVARLARLGFSDPAAALRLLADPLPRAELVADPAFAAAEVVRLPIGANPSYLTAAQLAPVLARLDEDELRAARWR